MRFPEFSGEWEKTTLGDVGKGFDYGMNAPAKTYDGMNKYIRITDIDEKQGCYSDSDVVSPEGNLSESYVVKEDDILLARTGASTGKSYLYNKKDGRLYFAGFLIRVNIDKENSKFIYTQLHTTRYYKWVKIMSARSGQPGINSQEYSSFPIYLPKGDEQNKIASLISLLDERIATQIGLIEDLKKLKSAIAEKVFCSPGQSKPHVKIRVYKDDWQLLRLSDFCNRIRTKNNIEHCSLVLTIAAQYGLVSQEDFFNKYVASENLDGYYLLRKGDFAYNKSYSGEYTWGAIKRLDLYAQGVLSPLYICFRADSDRIDTDFLVHYFESKKWHKGIADIAGEGARNHGLLNISVVDFFNTVHRIPCLDEQRHIAKVLNSIAAKIKNEGLYLERMNLQRKYLLQNMFV